MSEPKSSIDWSLTTWEGAEREQLRRWAALSLEEIVRAQEEMQRIADGRAAGQVREPRPGTGSSSAGNV